MYRDNSDFSFSGIVKMANMIRDAEQSKKEQIKNEYKKNKEAENKAVLWVNSNNIGKKYYSSENAESKEDVIHYFSILESRERRKQDEVHRISQEIESVESTLRTVEHEIDETEDGRIQYASMETSSYRSIRNIASSINRHYSLEKASKVTINAIARAEYSNNGHRSMCWVVNYLPERGIISSYVDKYGLFHAEFGQLTAGKVLENDGFTISKNTRMGEGIINFNRHTHSTHIYNRATWSVWSGIHNLTINIASDDKDYHFQTLDSLLSQFKFDYELYDKKVKIKNDLDRKRKELEKKLQQAKIDYNEAKNDRKKAEETISYIGERDKQRAEDLKRKELEQEKVAQQLRLKAEADKLKKEQETVLQELTEIKKKLDNDEKQIITARSFVREDHSLRSQHILDPSQEKAKRSHFYDGVPIIIVGGPGTGKTTTVIQRLKFLISPEAFADYNTMLSEDNVNEILNPTEVNSNWLFISPNEPLLLFLRENMRREGLFANEENTKTIDSYRENMFKRYEFASDKTPLTSLQNRDLSERSLILHPYSVAKMLDTYIAERLVNELYDIFLSAEDISSLKNTAIRLRKELERRFANQASLSLLINLFYHLQENEKENITNAIKEIKEKSPNQSNILKKLRRFTTGVGANLVDRIPEFYISFREDELHKEQSDILDQNLLSTIVKNGKFVLSKEEQCLLIGFINNLLRRIPQNNKDIYKSLKSRYNEKYIKNRKYVMTIDEATDYSPIEYYFMISFLNPSFSSLTMCGDLMQGLLSKGIKRWEDIHEIVGGKDADIIELTTSYRQLPKLVNMARVMYKEELGSDAPFQTCKPFNESDPEPLCIISSNEEKKIEWLAERLRDIYIDYDKNMPSVGLFIGKHEDAQKFTSKISNYKNLLSEITIADCTHGKKVDGNNVVRVFSIDEVKGMEFEVAIFYDLDKALENTSINYMRRFLYVGISRATTHLAATFTKKEGNEDIIKYFATSNVGWR